MGSPLPLYSFPLKLNLVCQYILQSGEFCTCLHSAGILGKLTGCNNQVVTGVDSWPGTVCAGSYSETQHFTSRRVPGSCCFSILEFSGGLTALQELLEVLVVRTNPQHHTPTAVFVSHHPHCYCWGPSLSLASCSVRLGFVFMQNMLWQTLGSPGNGTEAVFYLFTTATAGITWALQNS